MKKKLFISIGFSIILLIGSILFIRFNFSTKQVPQKDFYVVKFQGIDYPCELTFVKDSLVSQALSVLGILDVEKIYEVISGKQKEINLDAKITHDTTYKIINR